MLKHIKNLSIQVEDRPLTKDQPIKIIEHKGKGHPDKIYKANDTSAAIGFAPPTPTKKLVLSIEQNL